MNTSPKLVIERLKKLDKESLIAYWIKGEFEEAELYRELAVRAKEVGLPESLIETFWALSKESEGHGKKMKEIYVRTYGKEPEPPDIPSLEVYSIVKNFAKIEDAVEALQAAMQSEELAESIYTHLAKTTDDPELRDLYTYLAKVERGHYERLAGELEILKEILRERK